MAVKRPPQQPTLMDPEGIVEDAAPTIVNNLLPSKEREHMTVREGKQQIVAILEELQQQGVWIRGIRVEWRSQVPAEDVPSPAAKIRAEVWLEADL